jgi:hypothetical protein
VPTDFDIELPLLLEAIHLKYSYDFRSYAPSSLKRRLAQALEHFGSRSLSALQERVLREPALASCSHGRPLFWTRRTDGDEGHARVRCHRSGLIRPTPARRWYSGRRCGVHVKRPTSWHRVCFAQCRAGQ